MKKEILTLSAVICSWIFVFSAFTAQAAPINVDASGFAIKGYDSVAYFTQGQPVKGLEEFKFAWGGATWLFSSRENLEMFQKDPEKYAPQYGGY